MNLILLEPSVASGDHVVLTDRQARHIIEVIRPTPGDSLRVGVIAGNKGTALVQAIDDTTVSIAIGELDQAPPVARTSLVLAVPRPKVLARVIAAAASQNVARIDLINAWRVEKSYFGSPSMTAEALARMALLGCEQGGLTHLPDVVVHRRFMLWLEGLAPPGDELRLVAHPRTRESLASLGAIGAREATICIGPEGGWIEAELKSLAGARFRPFKIGETIVAVQTAVASALGQLELLRALR